LLDRAKKTGFSVLVVTLDTTLLGFRPNDLDTSHLPFLNGQGCQVGFSDPTFCKREGIDPAVYESGDVAAIRKASMTWLGEVNSGYFHSWEDVAFLKENWDGPIVLKGPFHCLVLLCRSGN
jgi:lactate 2-monooxygenase